MIFHSLTNSANKYPWIINPTDNLTFSPSKFNPLQGENYTDFIVKSARDEPIVNRFTFAHFPRQEQLYWLLPGNRIVVETKGWQSGILYQGQSTEIESRESIRLTQKLWGMQAVLPIPQSFKELTGEIDNNQFSIQSIAGEVINPPGSPTPEVIINSGDSNSLIASIPQISKLGTASTYNPKGGGSLFEFLDADNAPLILQSFPTSNLQPLLEAENITTGTIIPKEILEKIGFYWGNPLTGEKTRFQPQMTSLPGIKIGQEGKFDNWDMLNLLINPFISQRQRNLYYLNSLYWVPLGERATNIRLSNKQENYHWQRLYFSRSHNRTLLEYDPVKIKATYTNVFSNPGISVSLSVNKREIDELQTANTTLGMLMGGIFEVIRPPQLEQSLQEAKKRFFQQDDFASLNTKATPEEIRKINQLLNRTLLLGNRTSGLEQVSGTLTFPSKITPNNSSILQIRTGNHQRAVQFIDGNRTWRQSSKTFISKADLSNNNFGPLTFIGVPVPLEQTSIRPNNRSSAAQVSLINSNGKKFVQNWSSADMTQVPINIRSFGLAFDHIELSQFGEIITQLQAFNGYLSLPTLEFLWAGSSGDWNYSVNSGIWFNLNGDSVFNIPNNNLGLSEPTLGIYANGGLSYINTHAKVDADGKIQAITTHIPALRFYWNSATNSQNPGYLNLSYFFSHQDQNLNYSLAPALIFLENKGHLTPAGFLQGTLLLSTGLEFNAFVEFSDNFFYTLEGIQRINQNWSFGGYLQNFRDISRGVKSRTNDLSYGLLIKHGSSDSGTFWESRLGMSGDSFEVRFEGGRRF
ncbi:hypothetical protein IQ276_022900 [Desmonostoc muscorum LEGE 12446]|uniref:hypothetical protein n=1 Tax=Desmonostoc muscorum TaxID=1179 RepID=UPI001D15B577|nr:hypothetical protein [Desmonostoc muscorum]MCF2149222.1 hypothetical protein [Desmonostoc muscorum LEGE 12446]